MKKVFGSVLKVVIVAVVVSIMGAVVLPAKGSSESLRDEKLLRELARDAFLEEISEELSGLGYDHAGLTLTSERTALETNVFISIHHEGLMASDETVKERILERLVEKKYPAEYVHTSFILE